MTHVLQGEIMVKIIIVSISDTARKLEVIRMIRTVTDLDTKSATDFCESVAHGERKALPAEYPAQLAKEYQESFSAIGVLVELEQIESSVKINPSPKPRQYEILWQKLCFDSAAERYFDLMLLEWDAQMAAETLFFDWYAKQGSVRNVLANFENSINCIFDTAIADPFYEVLKSYKIYDISGSTFAKNYLSTKYIRAAFSDLSKENDYIDLEQQDKADYRQERKDSRGRVVGGGFGFSGAVKGMVTAGAMNAATGLIHGAFNAIGNVGSAISAASAKSSLYSSSKIKSSFSDAIRTDAACTFFNCVNLINSRRGASIAFQLEVGKSNALFENALSVPEMREELLLQSLQCCPWNVKVLEYIYSNYSEDRKTVLALANRFNVSVDRAVQKTHEDEDTDDFDDFDGLDDLEILDDLDAEDGEYFTENVVVSPQKGEMMFCTSCGKQISRSSKFCTFCGSAVTYEQ